MPRRPAKPAAKRPTSHTPRAIRRPPPPIGRESPGLVGRELDEDLFADLVDAGSREHYADAALYDYEYRRRRGDVNFYRELARQRFGNRPGRILDLGAGTGRVTIPLARDGHHVVALDQSAPMLARLDERVAALPAAVRDRIETVRGDLRTFSVGARFPLVIAAFNVLEHLYTRGEVDACLRSVIEHLEPGGAFAFDVQLPDLEWLVRDPTKRWAKTRFTDPTTGIPTFYSTNHDYDPVGQIVLIRLYYDPVEGGPGRVVKLSQRKFFPAELEALIAHAGLVMAERYGDFSFGPLEPGSESQVVVCTEPKARRKPG
ncbi:MAG: methyltransferase domain-containing protein [Kofleriaceae bacterium]